MLGIAWSVHIVIVSPRVLLRGTYEVMFDLNIKHLNIHKANNYLESQEFLDEAFSYLNIKPISEEKEILLKARVIYGTHPAFKKNDRVYYCEIEHPTYSVRWFSYKDFEFKYNDFLTENMYPSEEDLKVKATSLQAKEALRRNIEIREKICELVERKIKELGGE